MSEQERTNDHRPSTSDPNAWKVYWKDQGQPWRTEPEIDAERQKYLTGCRSIMPDVKRGIFPFKDIKLNRSDVEWLLATHENGRGPIDWNDTSQRSREGLDLRGSNMCQINLQDLPLARLRCGLTKDEQTWANEELCAMARAHMEAVILKKAQLQGSYLHHVYLDRTDLSEAQLEGSDLTDARLQGSNFFKAQLPHADLSRARLQEGSLYRAQLQGATLRKARLEKVDLYHAQLEDADLRETQLEGAYLRNVALTSQKRTGPLLADVQWTAINLAIVDWSQGMILGDEQEARKKKIDRQEKSKGQQLIEYERAVRANRQLGAALQTQGLNEEATFFAYRAQVLQKSVLWLQMTQQAVPLKQRMLTLGAWLFTWFLFLLAGYGYRLGRSFVAYLLVITAFATMYLIIGRTVGPSLSPLGALVFSMTSFHGRGFFPGGIGLDDPLTVFAAIEAFVGLLIEVTFIATLTQRLFGK